MTLSVADGQVFSDPAASSGGALLTWTDGTATTTVTLPAIAIAIAIGTGPRRRPAASRG